MPIVTLLRNVRNENITVEQSCRQLSKIKAVLAVKISNFIKVREIYFRNTKQALNNFLS